MMPIWIPAIAGMTIAFAAASKEVAVDVGHHAAEPGVISASGRAEFEYNRDLALEVKAELERAGLQVRLIGERGDYAVLHHRTRDARGADLFVSIHHDSVQEHLLPQAERFAGFSLFISRLNPRKEKSLACASAIGAKLRGAGFTPSRYHADPVLGEARPFADEANGVHYYPPPWYGDEANQRRAPKVELIPARSDAVAKPEAPGKPQEGSTPRGEAQTNLDKPAKAESR